MRFVFWLVTIISASIPFVIGFRSALNGTSNDEKTRLLFRAILVAYMLTVIAFLIFGKLVEIQLTINYSNGTVQSWIKNAQSDVSHLILLTCLVFGVALFLFYLKTRRQLLYGILEIVFSFISVIYVLSTTDIVTNNEVTFYFLFPFMSTVYLIVRGLNNLSDGYKKLEESSAKINDESDIPAETDFKEPVYAELKELEEFNLDLGIMENLKIMKRNITYMFSPDL